MNHLLSANTRPREESGLRRIGWSGKNASEAGTRKWFFSWGEKRALGRQTEIDDSSTWCQTVIGEGSHDQTVCLIMMTIFAISRDKKKGIFGADFFVPTISKLSCATNYYVTLSITNMWQKPTSETHSTFSKAFVSIKKWKVAFSLLTCVIIL